jgi:AmmeMemoRadiSam system protein A
MLSDDEKRQLLAIARAAIAGRLTGGALAPAVPAGALAQPGGAFVTVRCDRQLRGCIGSLEWDRAIAEVVARVAVSAASDDPRFPSVTADELLHLELEISLLGPLEAVAGADAIEVGRHGVVIEEGWRRGLLLPQVAVEWGWDRETFLSQAAVKAGLPPDAWKTGAKIYRFEAEVFGESDG